MTMRLAEIRELACRFVPGDAADDRLYSSGSYSWWPAHEIGHFLVATRRECRQKLFGIDSWAAIESSRWRYVVAREAAAISISQRILRRSGHVGLADVEIQYTDEDTLECTFERWCRSATSRLLRANRAARLPITVDGMRALLVRKARDVGSTVFSSARAAINATERSAMTGGQQPQLAEETHVSIVNRIEQVRRASIG